MQYKYNISIVKVKDLQYCLPGILFQKKHCGVVVSRAEKSKSTTQFFCFLVLFRGQSIAA